MTHQPSRNSFAEPASQLLTEDQIECFAERRMDALDTLYLSGRISDGEYQASVAGLDAWATLERTYILVRTR